MNNSNYQYQGESLNGIGSFFNTALKEVGPQALELFKGIASKLVRDKMSSKSSSKSSNRTTELMELAMIKAEENKKLLMYGGIGAAALITVVLITKRK